MTISCTEGTPGSGAGRPSLAVDPGAPGAAPNPYRRAMSTSSAALPRPDRGGRSTVYGTAGMVACEHPLAALEGIRALDDGGTAADACVAMAAVLAVVAPMMTGLGGDAFLLWFDPAEGRVRALEGAGRAGAGASAAALRARGLTEMPASGGAPVTVPGA